MEKTTHNADVFHLDEDFAIFDLGYRGGILSESVRLDWSTTWSLVENDSFVGVGD